MQEIKYVPIDSIQPSPENPRVIDANQFAILCDSIKNHPKFLEVRPILVNAQNIIFAGNMRWRAAKELGLTEVPVAVMELTPEQEKELMIRDNIQNGVWNYDLLGNWDFKDLMAYGFEERDLKMHFDLGLEPAAAGEAGAGEILPSNDKQPFEQITFTLSQAQAVFVKECLEQVAAIDFTGSENPNKHGNALHLILQQWKQNQQVAEQSKSTSE